MFPIWVCPEVANGDQLAQLIRIGDVVYGTCGQIDHFNDLRRPGATKMRSAHHFGDEVVSMASLLPSHCRAERHEDGWTFHGISVEDVDDTQGSRLVTGKELGSLLDRLLADPRFVFFFSDAGSIAYIRKDSGQLSVPFWCEFNETQREELQKEFAGNTARYVGGQELQNLLEDFIDFGIPFLNVRYKNEPIEKLVLVDELQEALHN